MLLKIQKLHDKAIIPEYQTDGAAGLDLCATQSGRLEWMERMLIPTGIAIQLPKGYEGQIRGRSGLASRNGILVFPGTVDADYRGELRVIVVNLDKTTFYYSTGDRVAQLIINRIERARISEVKSLGETERGTKGFGSTGVGT